MTMKARTVLASVALLTLVLVAACGEGTSSGPGPQNASGLSGSAPDFALEDVSGEEFRLSEHIGDAVILVNFWATWCEPCRIEMPHLNRMQETYGDQGLIVLCIAMDGPESVSRVRSHVSRYNFEFTVLLDQESEVTQLYNPRRAAPFNALIDRSGNIVWSHEGYSPGDEEELEEQIRELLGPAPAAE